MSIHSFSKSGPANCLASRAQTALGLLALIALAFVVSRASPVQVASLLAAAVVGFAVLRFPQAGLIALALAIPFARLIPLPGGLPGVSVVELLLVGTVASWLLTIVRERRATTSPRPARTRPFRAFDLLLLTFLWITAASLTQANSWSEGAPEWIKWAEFGLAYFLAARLLDRAGVRWLVAALLAAGVLQAGIGAYQFFTQSGPEAFLLLGRYMRASGTFLQPNPYAGYLGYLAPVSASLALGALGLWWRRRTGRALAWVLAYGAVTAALVAGILMSWSRGAWLGLGAALIAVAGFRTKRTAVLTAAMLLVLTAAVVLLGTGWLPAALENRVADLGGYLGGPDPARTEINDANFSVLERLAHWQAGWRMFEDHPLLGVGIGNYEVAYGDYNLPRWYEPLGHAHNIFINFAAETGVLGAAAFLSVWIGIAAIAATTIRRGGFAGALATGVLGSWVYLTIHNLFDNLFVQYMQLQIALLVGALAALVALAPPAARRAIPVNRGYLKPMALRASYPMTSELPPFLAWLVRLPLVNRLGLEKRPRELVRFLKFAAVGAFGAVVDMTVLNIMHKVFGLHLLAANTISVSVAIVSNFVWNRYWTFPESRERPITSQLGKFAIVNIIGLGINNLVFWVLTHIMANFIHDPWNYNIAKLGAIGVVLFWNYFINRNWTYRGIE